MPEEPITRAPNPIVARPRLTDLHGISVPQARLDFAVPFVDEDIPLYVDPFLLWKSPSQQDQALHTLVLNSFNHLGSLVQSSKLDEARQILITASECPEVGLGVSRTRYGQRIGEAKANEILDLYRAIPAYARSGFRHFEEIQLYVGGIASDRISDIACSFLKSFLIDYTHQEARAIGVPCRDVAVPEVYDYKANKFGPVKAAVPVAPDGRPVLLVPKRWLRFGPWISFEEYFRDYCPWDDVINPGEPKDPVKVLRYNRDNYAAVQSYVEAKERVAEDCVNDPLFKQIPIVSARNALKEIRSLPSGKSDGADREYESAIGRLLASLLYPQLDFAQEQSRTLSGVVIRDLLFYNNEHHPFLKGLREEYDSRQLVFEIKNVKSIEREHINQLVRYLGGGVGRFGVFVTRNEMPKSMRKSVVDLWSAQRMAIIALTDSDLAMMVDVYESKQRDPIDVLKKKYLEFRRLCPS